MKPVIPPAVLAQHVAILGKTGSGKTTTGKLCIEQVFDDGARVCVLDPIKSDWWGLTSSADGKRPGLPFQILGGPKGHVSLHSGAGKAIGELVGSGGLPHSIIDMADFEAGGLQKFFSHFIPALLRRMRGVLYLVMEEAHEFAPKERAGFSQENVAVHYAKKIATAGRSKGVRLIVMTQRVQALHNALLGSCDTMIVHRMTAPADQEPVEKWLKKNVSDKAVRTHVEESLSSLETGTAWLCSGEAKLFELVKLPRARTYDNTATPEIGSPEERAVKMADVDPEKLRALIGTAVAEAEANDPAKLKARIAQLEREAKKIQPAAAPLPAPAKNAEQAAQLRAALSTVKRLQSAIEAFMKFVVQINADGFAKDAGADPVEVRKALEAAAETAMRLVEKNASERARVLQRLQSDAGKLIASAQKLLADQTIEIAIDVKAQEPFTVKPAVAPVKIVTRKAAHAGNGADTGIGLGSGGKRRMLIALAQNPDGITYRKLSILADISRKGGTWRNYMSELRGQGLIEGSADRLQITEAGFRTLGDYQPLPTGDELLDYWRGRLGDSGKRAIFDVVVKAYPKAISKEEVSEQTQIALTGGTWRNYLSELRGLEIIEGSAELRASDDLFV